MRYVIINGSPRKGNSWAVVKQVKKNLEGEFDEVQLLKQDIPLCVGCFNCILKGEDHCPHFDKVNPIVEKIEKADAIIMTSPVYAMNVSGLLKNFLDHTAYMFHRPTCFTKKAMVIVTTAGAGHKDSAKYLDETLRHWGVNKVYKYAVACGGKDSLDKKSIDNVAKEFRGDVESKKMHSPKFNDIIFYNVWKAMAYHEDPIKPDKEFWFENDLVNYDFSPDVKLGFVKKLFSKIMFKIIKKTL